MKITTIKLSKETLQDLVALKKHPRETHEDVLKRLIAILKPKTKKNRAYEQYLKQT